MTRLPTIFSASILLGFALLAWLAPIASAQQRSITARAELPQQMYLGDSVDLYIAVTGSRNVEPPDLSGLKDFEAVYRAPQDSSSTMTTIINGRVSTQVNVNFSHLYLLTPKRAGTLEFPAITVVVDGRSYTTAPVQVVVSEPKLATDFKLTVSTEPAEAFVGQPITIRLAWQLGKDVRSPTLSLPISGPDHELFPGPQTATLTGNERGGVVQVRLNGQAVAALLQSGTLLIDRTIVPTKPGMLTVGPARADFLAVLGERERRTFDSFFEDRTITERQFSMAPQITIPVSELPAAGRPTNFSGLVGTYSINASVDAATVSVGDPITLSVGISGPYPLSLIPALDLARQSALKGQFRIPREPVLPQPTGQTAAFSAMIRARTAEAKEIGPITLNYFDPISKSYRVASTKPIPLTVYASSSVTLPDEPEEPASPAPVVERPGGLPDIDRSSTVWPGETFDLRDKLRDRFTLLLLGVPPALCLLTAAAVGFSRWQDRDPAAHRRRAALKHLNRELRQASSAAATLDLFARALHNFVADFFDEPRDTLTATRASELLEAGPSTASDLASIMRECDERRFGTRGSAEVDRASLATRALTAARAFVHEHSRRSASSQGSAA